MIEENRDYDGVEYLRSLYDGDFEFCFRECLREEYIHLINKGQKIYGATKKAYEYYIK
jgi:HD superfamily phosphohydrolase YqeK